MLSADTPAVILAPMHGVTDAPMRATQGETGVFSYAVTEFLRVSHAIPPGHVIARHVPELAAGGRTPTGLPVQAQLLGGDPGRMAETAARVCALGATAIDINFGCPAPTVNRHDGGATLLKDPTRLRAIVAAVRAAVPAHVPVSAKLRLGWDTTTAIDHNAGMAAEGGAAWLTIHARTRTQGYAPPVDWGAIGRVRDRLGIPVVANGDIWTVADFRRCRDATGCRHFMLGRGAFADPRLPAQVAAELGLGPRIETDETAVDWGAELGRLVAWSGRLAHGDGHDLSARVVPRLKQWLKMAANFGAFDRFEAVKLATSIGDVFAALGCAPLPNSLVPPLTASASQASDPTPEPSCPGWPMPASSRPG